MFYTNRSIRLHTRCLEYLELIQKANRRYEDKRDLLRRYEASKAFHPLRLMNERHRIAAYIERMRNLSDWLVSRYQSVFTELGSENLKQLKNRIKEIDLTLSTESLNVDL